ncbi:hypothetical protein BU25DRAFT_2790 [Macroventuria anomochaeta]|uniref:Uncharacterized protein n=1 Tax=Macroventuria anomochaeta TaxID=301207 RepID=A0ACB6SGH2_9PLEO|nr:uncharacterized protein BU25DRAFT_2790 [Macroventuria anomochaeta]KAF2633266.1 hypothetical protein BU25DRAFT_2790 [Macroventuria anomochaeta]
MLAVNDLNQRLNHIRQSTRESAVRSAGTRTPRPTPDCFILLIGAFDVFLVLVLSTSLLTYVTVSIGPYRTQLPLVGLLWTSTFQGQYISSSPS